MLRSVRFAAVCLLALPAFAFAQADDVPVPAANCIKPTVPAVGTSLDKAKADKLNAETTAYGACADAYLKARRATTKKYQDIANTHADAGNAFATDFNGFVATLEAFSKAQAAKAAAAKEKK